MDANATHSPVAASTYGVLMKSQSNSRRPPLVATQATFSSLIPLVVVILYTTGALYLNRTLADAPSALFGRLRFSCAVCAGFPPPFLPLFREVEPRVDRIRKPCGTPEFIPSFLFFISIHHHLLSGCCRDILPAPREVAVGFHFYRRPLRTTKGRLSSELWGTADRRTHRPSLEAKAPRLIFGMQCQACRGLSLRTRRESELRKTTERALPCTLLPMSPAAGVGFSLLCILWSS